MSEPGNPATYTPIKWHGKEITLSEFGNLLWLQKIEGIPTRVADPQDAMGESSHLYLAQDPITKMIVWFAMCPFGVMWEQAVYGAEDAQRAGEILHKPLALKRHEALEILEHVNDGLDERTQLKLDPDTLQVHMWFQDSQSSDDLLMKSYQLEHRAPLNYDKMWEIYYQHQRTVPDDAFPLTYATAKWVLAAASSNTRIQYENGFLHTKTMTGGGLITVGKPDDVDPNATQGTVLEFGKQKNLVFALSHPELGVHSPIDIYIQPGRAALAQNPVQFYEQVKNGTYQTPDQVVLRLTAPTDFFVLTNAFGQAYGKLLQAHPEVNPEDISAIEHSVNELELMRLKALTARLETENQALRAEIAQLKGEHA